jgi:hypothetical protein
MGREREREREAKENCFFKTRQSQDKTRPRQDKAKTRQDQDMTRKVTRQNKTRKGKKKRRKEKKATPTEDSTHRQAFIAHAAPVGVERAGNGTKRKEGLGLGQDKRDRDKTG